MKYFAASVVRSLCLLEALPRQALIDLLQRAVVDLDLRFYVRLLPWYETGCRVDPLTRSLSLGRQNHDSVEQDGCSSVALHLIEPDEVHARRRARSSRNRHRVSFYQMTAPKICALII